MNDVKQVIRQVNSGLNHSMNGEKIITFINKKNESAQRTIVANSALMYARANQKTIIVDTDFSGEIFPETFHVNSTYGLSDYIDNHNITESSIINEVPGQNLSIVSSGTLAEAETKFLLGDPRFSRLLEVLATDFDRILINTTSNLVRENLTEIAKNSDGVILIFQPNTNSKKDVRSLIRDLEDFRGKILGYISVEDNQ